MMAQRPINIVRSGDVVNSPAVSKARRQCLLHSLLPDSLAQVGPAECFLCASLKVRQVLNTSSS